MVTTKQYRFSGPLGEEYRLFKLACPHYDELEAQVGLAIKRSFGPLERKHISVLEIGCGSGYTTSFILDSNSRVKITAVDNEPVMISQAQVALQEEVNSDQVKLETRDALDYLRECSNGSFDVIASGFTIHNFHHEYRSQVLKEIYRVLKPGGLFVNGDKYAQNNEQEHQQSLQWQLNMFEQEFTKIGRLDLVKEWTEHYLEDNEEERIMKEGEYEKEIESLGFVDVKTTYRNRMDAVVVGYKY